MVCSGQRCRVEQPVVALCGGVHQRTVLGFELGFEGVDTIMCLAPLAAANGQKGRVLAFAMRTAQRGDSEFADSERMGGSK